MSLQGEFARALLDPQQPVPARVVTWNGSDPARRMAVYRNNVIVSLVDALAQTFPVTLALVGEEFFRAMAQVFVRAHPPAARVLCGYGAGLPDFIEGFAPAASLPWLADVARLEMLRLEALHAADAPAMDSAGIAAIVSDPLCWSQARWRLSPSLRVFRSPHAVVSLWAAHQGDSGLRIGEIDLRQPQAALVFRRGLEVLVWPSVPGADVLAECLSQGLPMAPACQRALDAAPQFDPAVALASLLRFELLAGADFPAPSR